MLRCSYGSVKCGSFLDCVTGICMSYEKDMKPFFFVFGRTPVLCKQQLHQEFSHKTKETVSIFSFLESLPDQISDLQFPLKSPLSPLSFSLSLIWLNSGIAIYQWSCFQLALPVQCLLWDCFSLSGLSHTEIMSLTCSFLTHEIP